MNLFLGIDIINDTMSKYTCEKFNKGDLFDGDRIRITKKQINNNKEEAINIGFSRTLLSSSKINIVKNQIPNYNL